MPGFLNQPSLSSGLATTISGLLLLIFGVIVMAPGIRLAVAAHHTSLTFTLLVLGLAIVLGGGILVGLGVRAVMRFERRLLLAVASRGRVQA